MKFGRQLPTFKWDLLRPFSISKMKAVDDNYPPRYPASHPSSQPSERHIINSTRICTRTCIQIESLMTTRCECQAHRHWHAVYAPWQTRPVTVTPPSTNALDSPTNINVVISVTTSAWKGRQYSSVHIGDSRDWPCLCCSCHLAVGDCLQPSDADRTARPLRHVDNQTAFIYTRVHGTGYSSWRWKLTK